MAEAVRRKRRQPGWEATGEQKYPDYAVQFSYYLSTWLWHYGGVYPPDDDPTKFSYSTFGATSVSVQHNCLDGYGLVADERLVDALAKRYATGSDADAGERY
ncbi:MAG: hypothetical protein LBK22_06825 [Tannerella sp.]|nr:hypothetical protein [Tannerella sp.]